MGLRSKRSISGSAADTGVSTRNSPVRVINIRTNLSAWHRICSFLSVGFAYHVHSPMPCDRYIRIRPSLRSLLSSLLHLSSTRSFTERTPDAEVQQRDQLGNH